MSSTDPNLQQQPSPDRDPEVAGNWRKIFVPDDDGIWACCDYNGQEPRLTVHYAAKYRCRGVEVMLENYAKNPRFDLHQVTANMMGVKRKSAKTIFLGRCYSMGAGKLCKNLGLPMEDDPEETKRFQAWMSADIDHPAKVYPGGKEGKALLKKFDDTVPFVKEISQLAMDYAARNGYINTALGKRCRFQKSRYSEAEIKYARDINKKLEGWKDLHKALNRVIQGSGAYQMKKAMVDAVAAGVQLQLQVHDELDTTVGSRSEAERLGEIMVNSIPLLVPVVVDVETGPSWGEIE